ncbi:uncharacterized protein [Coffea arabica]|uniref:DUF4283 domain-containing protein n=1 Tax=Coffea arabica TaxID=13443 RepID=A0A6P6T0X9_COFAR|nr:uncharacterized protein LOC113696789 [Coffea arabica]
MAGFQPPGGRASRSFTEVLQDQPSLSPCKIRPISQFKGEPAILFSKKDIAKMVAPFKFAIVEKFSHGRPSLDAMRKSFSTIGFQSSFNIGLLDQRHVLIRFGLEEDYLRCWMKGLWSIADFSMRVFKWSPNFQLTSESSHAPVWIALEQLPVHFFNRASLFSIASAIGSPLKVNSATATLARPNVARVCVDLDVSKDPPGRVWIAAGSHGFWQKVAYKNLPPYCSVCHQQGHPSSGCR